MRFVRLPDGLGALREVRGGAEVMQERLGLDHAIM